MTANLCKCGWRFLAFDKSYTKCPQCRDVVRTCKCCGAELNGRGRQTICKDCKVILEKVSRRISNQRKKVFFRETVDESICNMDCFNCKYSDCILPVDEE